VSSSRPPYGVIGGGITGLVAARTLEQAGHEVVLFESTERLGGKIRTDLIDGLTIESGADSFLAREPWAVELCRELGLGDELVAPATYGALIWTDDGLKPMPPGFLRGFPTSLRAAFKSGLLSPAGALRAAGDLFLPGPLTGADTSLGGFARRRFGPALLEHLIDPVLAGTRAGVPEEISLAAAAPEIDRVARSHRSVMRGLKAVRGAGQLETGAPPFITLRSGMQTLVEALEKDLNATDIHTGAPVTRIARSSDAYRLTTNTGDTEVTGLVLTAPSFAAAPLLREVSPTTSGLLAELRYASGVSIAFVFEAGAVEVPEGSGLLVPRSRERTLTACTWFSKKWPQHAASDGRITIRCFVGRAGRSAVLQLTEDALIERVLSDLGDATHVTAPPRTRSIVRWDDSLPQYAVGHLDVVTRAEASLAGERIVLAGAGYRGSGIPDCIRQGADAARRLTERLG